MKIIQNKVNFRQTVRIFNSNLLLEGIVPLNPSENENNRQLLLVSITYLKISVALLVQKLLSSKVSAQTKNLFD
jgi:hydrogenase-4 membrane subunit HyfE